MCAALSLLQEHGSQDWPDRPPQPQLTACLHLGWPRSGDPRWILPPLPSPLPEAGDTLGEKKFRRDSLTMAVNDLNCAIYLRNYGRVGETKLPIFDLFLRESSACIDREAIDLQRFGGYASDNRSGRTVRIRRKRKGSSSFGRTSRISLARAVWRAEFWSYSNDSGTRRCSAPGSLLH